MTTGVGQRIGWDDVPLHVRAEVERILGSPDVEARSQIGGFSPGTADRVRTIGGRRAFVKAAGRSLSEGTVRLHRRETAVTAALSDLVPAPTLLGSYDDGTGWPSFSRTSTGAIHALRGTPPNLPRP